MQNKEEITIEKIIEKMKKNNPKSDEELIKKAYNYAKINHKDQKRMSGEDYIVHPLAVAYILADLELDDSTICAAILHDIVEDTEATHQDLVNEFGEEIAYMVEGVTKLRKNPVFYHRRTASRKLQKNVSCNGKGYKSNTYKTCR